MTERATRRSLHCGWMDPSEWTKAELPPAIGPDPYTCDVCPGWLLRQPAVIDGSIATTAFKQNQLAAAFPDLENTVVEAATLGVRAFNLFQAEEMARKARRNG